MQLWRNGWITLKYHLQHILGTVSISTTLSECTSTACYILWMGARLSNTMCITIEGHVQGVPDWYYTAYFSSTIITWILCKPLFACNSNGSFLLPITVHVQVQVFTVEIKKFLSVAFCNNLQCAKKKVWHENAFIHYSKYIFVTICKGPFHEWNIN